LSNCVSNFDICGLRKNFLDFDSSIIFIESLIDLIVAFEVSVIIDPPMVNLFFVFELFKLIVP
jgi:hypothetical protein